MQEYKIERERQTKRSRVSGIGFTVALHVVFALILVFSGMTYLDPPPPEREEILIDFDDFEPKVVQQRQKRLSNTRLRSPQPDRTRPDELVKMSKAQLEGTKQNYAEEATVGPDGDVEVNEPPREKEINKRALFHAAENPEAKDTLAPQTARTPSDELDSGHASGNIEKGRATGEPNARLAGRSVVGSLKKPASALQRNGVVVVKIKVNQNGAVVEAIPGEIGTTVTDKTLWNEARKAAMEAKFSPTTDLTKTTQYGKITYVYRVTTR